MTFRIQGDGEIYLYFPYIYIKYTHTHTLNCYNYTTVLNRYRKIPGDKCEGGFSPPRREGKDILLASSKPHSVRPVSGQFFMTRIIDYTVAKNIK